MVFHPLAQGYASAPPPLSPQSPARLFRLFLLSTNDLLFASFLCPPKGGQQQAIHLLIVNQPEFLQNRRFNRAARQFFHWKELVDGLQNTDIVLFFHFISVKEG